MEGNQALLNKEARDGRNLIILLTQNSGKKQ